MKSVKGLVDAEQRRFSAKLILFGEYSMIYDASSLLMPYDAHGGCWKRGLETDEARCSNGRLRDYHKFLMVEGFSRHLDLSSMCADLDDGLWFSSDIPMGYGLGSSGALVAAVYQRYSLQDTDVLTDLRALLSSMECYFHGKSSGNDPLLSYLDRPYVQFTASEIQLLPRDFLPNDISIFLIDTQASRHTSRLVGYFNEQRSNASYCERFSSCYLPVVRSCISTLVSGDTTAFFRSLRQLSAMQIEFLNPMVHPSLKSLFTVDSDFPFGVKILGSGGGGYALGFTDNKVLASNLLEQYKVIWL